MTKPKNRSSRPQPSVLPPWKRPSEHLTNLRSLTGVSFLDPQIKNERTGTFTNKSDAELQEDPAGWHDLGASEQRRVIGQCLVAQMLLLDDLRRIGLRSMRYLANGQKSRIRHEQDDDDRPIRRARQDEDEDDASMQGGDGLTGLDYNPDDDDEAPPAINDPKRVAALKAEAATARAKLTEAKAEPKVEAKPDAPKVEVQDADGTPVA